MTALDLSAISDEFLIECGICDYGIGSPCKCPDRDFRPVMLDLVRDVERLRSVLADVSKRMHERAEFCGDTPDHLAMVEFARELRAAVNP